MADMPPALMQPPGQVSYVPPANGSGGIVPSRSGAASPGFAGAILDLIRALSQGGAPRSVVQHPSAVGAAIGAQERGNASPGGLGDQLAGR